jgi:hypothetical protein
VANDNDFSADSGDNKFFVFGVTDADLARIGASYTAQTLSPVPEAHGYGMLLAGMGMICLVGRRRKNEVFRKDE